MMHRQFSLPARSFPPPGISSASPWTTNNDHSRRPAIRRVNSWSGHLLRRWRSTGMGMGMDMGMGSELTDDSTPSTTIYAKRCETAIAKRYPVFASTESRLLADESGLEIHPVDHRRPQIRKRTAQHQSTTIFGGHVTLHVLSWHSTS
ncbi:hypothetical protein AC579_7000 [Pseudocercospora musae]|uniref:Uncharacterized protein n=1 Tax=Pseudocercospora musae TaxID=113226 RepID=A0A139I9I9_9PEZI|nr:hypothetical protein AC579_7000 [Pseudocercospora musae]